MSALSANPLLAASQWYALLSSEEATADDFEAWQKWKDARTENQLAWQKVEAVTQRVKDLPHSISTETFSGLPSFGRRRALKQLVVLLGVGTGTMLTYQHKPWREILADHITATGEIREIMLPDGSRIFINTASAVNIRFTEHQRLVELVKGEVLIHTAPENEGIYRPFVLSTRHGTITALGTKFNVRDFDHNSQVSVSEGAVKVAPVNGIPITIQAGQSVIFDKKTSSDVAEEVSSAWVKGLLVVYSMPLGDFAAELSRYRSGMVRCDPAIRYLLVSGSFFTADTDVILENLPRILPVKIEWLTRYWVTIQAT